MNELPGHKKNNDFNIKPRYLFLFNFIFLLFICLPNLQFRFASDGYYLVNNPNNFLDCGRLFAYFTDRFQNLFSHPVFHQQFWFFVYIFILTLCVVMVFYTYAKFRPIDSLREFIFVDLSIVFGFCNVLMEEIFCFPEDYLPYGLGLLLCVLAVYYFLRNNKISTKDCFISFLLLTIGVNFYQIFLQIWFVLTIFLLLIKYDSRPKDSIFSDIYKSISVGVCATVINVILVKILSATGSFSGSRNISLDSIRYNSFLVFNNILYSIEHPIVSVVGLPIILMILLAFLEFFILLINKEIRTKLSLESIFLSCSLLVIFGMNACFNQVQFLSRTLLGIGFIISAFVIFININLKDTKYISKLYYFFCVVLFFINIYLTQSISIDNYAFDRLDQEYACNIVQRIFDYEQEHKIKIKKLSFHYDDSCCFYYDGNIKFSFGDTNRRSLVLPWSDLSITNYYSKRNFEKIDMPKDVYEKYFANKNWDYYKPEEQLVFISDTLYICVY